AVFRRSLWQETQYVLTSLEKSGAGAAAGGGVACAATSGLEDGSTEDTAKNTRDTDTKPRKRLTLCPLYPVCPLRCTSLFVRLQSSPVRKQTGSAAACFATAGRRSRRQTRPSAASDESDRAIGPADTASWRPADPSGCGRSRWTRDRCRRRC